MTIEFDIEEIKINIVYEDGTEEQLNSSYLSDDMISQLYKDIDKNLTDDVVRGALSAEQLSIKLELIIKGVQALVDEAEHSQKRVEAL